MSERISHQKKTSRHLGYIMKEIILNKKEEQVRSNICYTMLQCYGKRKVFNLIKVHAEVRSVKNNKCLS